MSRAKASSTSPDVRSSDLPIPGLEGTNPLGFLAALGLFKTLEQSLNPAVLTMAWTRLRGNWIPVLHTDEANALDEKSVLEHLTNTLVNSIEAHPARVLAELNTASDDERARKELLEQSCCGEDAVRAEWITAFASDFAPPDSINQLQTARRDYFYGNLSSVISSSQRAHLQRAIFKRWDYADALDNQSLHWDPSEDRRHAYQWNKPAGDPDRKKHGGMLGANRLALEAIPLFPSFPENGSLRTLGFTGNRSSNTRWTWPIWTPHLRLTVIRSLLAAPELQLDNLDAKAASVLEARGVIAVYRTRRILVGKTPNFTPPLCIM